LVLAVLVQHLLQQKAPTEQTLFLTQAQLQAVVVAVVGRAI
jgi:hypothetical protein